jgi:molybdopterin/thiamine biosynthesis adenylyltransferase
MTGWSVTMTREQWRELESHLYPGDWDEHAAVLRCGVARTTRGTRLLVHDIVFARDGIDYVPGERGYRMLTSDFVRDTAYSCAQDKLVYLAVHCHGGTDSVEFSGADLDSHVRGYPALLDFTAMPVVGALVFARAAVAGDLWLAGGGRAALDYLRIVGRPQVELRPEYGRPTQVDASYDRQARLFGDRGQNLLAGRRVAVIGLGGAGSLICEYLARLGVGELVLIDPDRIETSNLSRVVGSRRIDAWPWLTDTRRPGWVRVIGDTLSTPKVNIAARVARQASNTVKVTKRHADVTEPAVAALLTTCDHIFLAADSHLARRLVDAITHQYLIPSTQVGAKVSIVDESGAIADIFSISRSNSPGHGCMRCNDLLDPAKMADEALSNAERRRQRYVDEDEVHAPSVISLNAAAASRAVDDWLMSVTGLTRTDVDPDHWVGYHPLDDETREYETAKDPNCPDCGPTRFALGDATTLPTRIR